MQYEDIKNRVTSTRSFGVKDYMVDSGEIVGFSSGIRILVVEEPDALKEIQDCLERFYNADWGTYYDDEEWTWTPPTHWEDKSAYGEYTIASLDEPIHIHYEPHGMMYDVVVYLPFER